MNPNEFGTPEAHQKPVFLLILPTILLPGDDSLPTDWLNGPKRKNGFLG